jgi:hypothetical protein
LVNITTIEGTDVSPTLDQVQQTEPLATIEETTEKAAHGLLEDISSLVNFQLLNDELTAENSRLT